MPRKSQKPRRSVRDGHDKNSGEHKPTETHRSEPRRARFAQIAELIEQQWSGPEIVEKLCVEHGISERMAQYDLAAVYEEFRKGDAEDQAVRIARARRAWQRQFRDCKTAQDRDAANYALDRLSRMDGVYAPKQVSITGTIGVAVEIRAVMRALDDAGLVALDLVMGQLKRAGIGLTPTTSAPATPQSALPSGG